MSDLGYSAYTQDVIDYIKKEYGVVPEFLWVKSPNNAAFRHPDNRKWFGALLLQMPRKTLGLQGNGAVDILNVKCDPRMVGSVIDHKGYLPAYHMNKEHWVTILLDGTVPMSEIAALIDFSFGLIEKRK